MKDLEGELRNYADRYFPLDKRFPDTRQYSECVNQDAVSDDMAWLKNGTSYIWKVGVLGQWDSNKCDDAKIFVGYERKPGNIEVLGHLNFPQGENDDIGRTLQRAVDLFGWMHPAFSND